MQPSSDGKSRFCQHCELHVHDLSAMTRQEAASLKAAGGGAAAGTGGAGRAHPGRLCVNYYPDRSGMPITNDRPWRLAIAKAGAVFGGLASMLLAACTQQRTGGKVANHRLGGSAPSPSIRLGGIAPWPGEQPAPPSEAPNQAPPGDPLEPPSDQPSNSTAPGAPEQTPPPSSDP